MDFSKSQDYIDLESELKGKWTTNKKHNEILGYIYDDLKNDLCISDSKIRRVNNCGSLLGFIKTDEKYKLHYANFCRDRFCPMCGWRKSLRRFSDTSRILNQSFIEYPDIKYAFLTLTIKNCSGDDLEKTLDILLKGYRDLTHKNRLFTKGIIVGSYRTIEITYSEKDGFHPHIHVIIALTKDYFNNSSYYMSQKKWSELWAKCINVDYNPVIDIRIIKNYDSKNTHNISSNDLYNAIKETSKYAVKGSQFLDPEDLYKSEYVVRILYNALANRKLCSFSGIFRDIQHKLNIVDSEKADLIHIDDNIEINKDIEKQIIYYKWGNGGYNLAF